MSTFVISLVVVGGTIGLVLWMVLGEETQPAMGARVRDLAGQIGRRASAAGVVGARTARSAGDVTARAARATATTVAEVPRRRRGFVPYEPMGEVLDGPELPWSVRIRSGLGLATTLALVGLALALVIGLAAIGLASALEHAVS